MGRTRLSVVCPAYNEETALPWFHGELRAVLASLETAYDVEIIYVDDGSRDRTLEVLRELRRQDPRVRYLSLSRNFGHQAALTAGLEAAQGEVVVTLDTDLQHPPSLIPELLEQWLLGNDVVLTRRADDPGLGLFKRLSSRCFYRVLRWLSHTDVQAAASDFRLLSRKALDALLQLREVHRFLRGMVGWLGFRTAVVPFVPAARAAGESKYSARRMVGLALDGLFSFSRLPVRVPFFLGLGSLLLSTLALAGAAAALAVPGWPCPLVLLALGMMLGLGGAILCSLGVVGEYVGRIYEQVKGRPLYLCKEVSPGAEAERPRPGLLRVYRVDAASPPELRELSA